MSVALIIFGVLISIIGLLRVADIDKDEYRQRGRNQAIHQIAVRITSEEPLPLEQFKVWQDVIKYLESVDWHDTHAGSKLWQERLRKENVEVK